MAHWVRLELDVAAFDATRFKRSVDTVLALGIRLTTLEVLGNTESNHRRMYDLNATCSADIPDRGPFDGWDEYRDRRIDVESFDPDGVIIALDGETWVGMSAASDHHEHGFVFNLRAVAGPQRVPLVDVAVDEHGALVVVGLRGT